VVDAGAEVNGIVVFVVVLENDVAVEVDGILEYDVVVVVVVVTFLGGEAHYSRVVVRVVVKPSGRRRTWTWTAWPSSLTNNSLPVVAPAPNTSPHRLHLKHFVW
jgi:hypothetical protein